MEQRRLEGCKVAILTETDFEQVEMTEPRRALQEAGAEAVLISPQSGQIQGMHHDVIADKFTVDLPLSQADEGDFDAVMLPGGALNADKLRMDMRARAFVQHFQLQHKPIAAICHAPWLLVSSGLARGRRLTSYYTIQDDIRNAGGDWTDREVLRDDNLLTSRQPSDIPAFNQAMIQLFAERRAEQSQRPLSEPVRGYTETEQARQPYSS